MTKEEMIAAVKRCADELGHVPTLDELRNGTGLNKYQIRRKFGSYTKLIRQAGFDASGAGHETEIHELFLDWIGIVRSLKKIPTISEYDLESKYSVTPLTRRFGGWKKVAVRMRHYALENGLEMEWEDEMKIIAEHLEVPADKANTFRKTSGLILRAKIQEGLPVYGPPLLNLGPNPMNIPFTYAPTDENGVLVAFGSVARELGFSILHVQKAFPDCEAMREIEPGRCQRARIEFEYASRNFLTHMHPISGCDLIVCWENNWPECPLEVIELRSAIKQKL